MKRITKIDVIFASMIIVGLVFAMKPFFTKQLSEAVVKSEDLKPRIAVTTLELPARTSPRQKDKECAAEKLCDNSKLILADGESNPIKVEVIQKTLGEPDGLEAAGLEFSQGNNSSLSEETEPSLLEDYPYGEPTPYTTQVVDALIAPVADDKPLTSEQAQQWKADLQDLVELGSEGLPAIWEYLNSFEDTLFLPEDAKALGYRSSRIALLDALQKIGGDEAIELSLQMLQATAEPGEIAFLAKALAEQETNDQAREAAVAAAREVLNMARSGEIEAEQSDVPIDVGPLFEVLHKYGDDRVIADLQQATTEWRYYASIALANLADGAGIPALVDMAKGDKELPSSVRSQALVMLAQVSTQSETARVTLVDAARSNQIPEFYWNHIASSLSGQTYRLETEEPTDTSTGTKSNASKNKKFHHIEGTNQNFITDSNGVELSEEEIDERLALIDELLAVNSSPKAVELLRKSQSELEDRFDQLASKPLDN